MMWNVCFALSVLALAAGVGFSVFLLRARFPKGRTFRPLHALFAGFFLAAFVLNLPVYHAAYEGAALQNERMVVLSLQKAIRVFGANEIYSDVFSRVGQAPEGVQTAYLAVVLVVQLVAPLLSFGFVLSFFKNISAKLRYAMNYFRDVYIFSRLNQRALLLAADIMHNHKRARIVFADAYDRAEGQDAEMMEKARALRAICFKEGIHTIDWSFHSKNKKIDFFALGHDEVQNVDHALRLIERYNQRENTHLFIFATGVEGELLLAGREKGKMKVRRVNPVRSLVLRTLHEEGKEIFRHARPVAGEEDKQISAVIAGMGGHGTEMLKALCWYCQMDGYRLKINAFDRDPLAAERFSALCPEIMSPCYNGVEVPGEAMYDIRLHPGCDVETRAFADGIAEVKDATYVFISLGSDESNIRTAVELRRLFARQGLHPEICAVISSAQVKKNLSAACNHVGQPYDIRFIGDAQTCYSEKVILRSEIEADAFRRHCAYCNGDEDQEENFWRHEYCYHSSMALAIHANARKEQHIPGAHKPSDQLTDKERDGLELLEHRRWTAYMRSEGFVYSGAKERSSRNDLAKMHNNLVPFDVLTEEVKRKDSRVGAAVGGEEKQA